MSNIIITMPDLKKEGIERLIEFYKHEIGYLFFRIPNLPKQKVKGKRCYIVSNGTIIGYHIILDARFVQESVTSLLSDGEWCSGNYIIRDAESFVELENKISMNGFRGFRYYKEKNSDRMDGCDKQ